MKRRALVFVTALLIASISQAKSLSFTIAPSDTVHMEVIKDAASVLTNICPAVVADYVKSVSAVYESDTTTHYKPKNPEAAWGDQEDDLTKPVQVKGQLGYRSEKYNWTYDVEFKVVDSKSGHNHWIYIGGMDDKVDAMVVLGKQESLDFCGISAKMNGHYYLPLDVEYK